MITSVALLSDFYCGWSFPRHLYSDNSYLVWGNMPYAPGDNLNHNLLELIYPGYELSSYYHDETGFLTPTPYADTADSLLSDAPLWLLNRYPLPLVADRLTGGDPRRNKESNRTERNAELIDKLSSYVEHGGRLVFTAGNLEALDGIFGLHVIGNTHFNAGSSVQFADGTEMTEPYSFELLTITTPENSRILAKCGKTPAAFEFSWGKGSVVVLTSPFGISSERAFEVKIVWQYDETLLNPYPLLASAEKIYRDELDKTEEMISDIGLVLVSGTLPEEENARVWSSDIPLGDEEKDAPARLFLTDRPELPQVDTCTEY